MKRFFDTELWKKEWFMDLTPAEKSAWFYLTANCDNVGVWSPNYRLANFTINDTSVDWDALPGKCNGNIYVMEDGKWWLCDFCQFQHPDLKESSGSNAVQSYVQLLKKHGLWEQYVKGTGTLHEGSREREQVQVRERVQDKDREKERSLEKWPDDSLEHCTLVTFQKDTPMFKDNHGNLAAIPRLIELAKSRGDPGKVLPGMINLFRRLRRGEIENMTNSDKKFWQGQPYTPKGMLQIWERLEPMAESFVLNATKQAESNARVNDFLYGRDEEDPDDVSFG